MGQGRCRPFNKRCQHLLAPLISLPAGPAQSPIWYPRARKNSPSRALFFDLFVGRPKSRPRPPKGWPRVSQGSPQNTKIQSKCPPAQESEEKAGKGCEKVYFPESWICNPHTPVQSKHTFSFSRFGRKSDPESLPKAPPNRPKSINNRFPSPCQNSCRKR